MKELEQTHKKAIVEYFRGTGKYWENIYDEYREKISFQFLEMRWRKEAILNFIDEYSNGKSLKILDVGCGVGDILKNVIERGHEVFAIDITSDMIRKAKSNIKDSIENNSIISLADIYNLPFSDEDFDLILCVGVLQYLPDDYRAIKELYRIIKKNGIAIITTPNILRLNILFDPFYIFYLAPKYIWNRLKSRLIKGSIKRQTIDFKYNSDFSNRRYYYGQLNKHFKKCHFENVKIYPIGFGPITLFRKDIMPINWSERINYWITKAADRSYLRNINFFANRWVHVLEKND